MRKDLEQHRLRAAVRGPGSADGRADRDLVAVNEDVLGDDADAGKPGGELAPGVLPAANLVVPSGWLKKTGMNRSPAWSNCRVLKYSCIAGPDRSRPRVRSSA
jgi:hypothetical protein